VSYHFVMVSQLSPDGSVVMRDFGCAEPTPVEQLTNTIDVFGCWEGAYQESVMANDWLNDLELEEKHGLGCAEACRLASLQAAMDAEEGL
jgi:hypothetical protein